MRSPRSALRALPPEGARRPWGGPAGAVAAIIAVAALAGCAYAPPKPWEKGELAKPTMQFDTDRLESRYQEHVYQSKEAAGGGYGVGGGGCGCN